MNALRAARLKAGLTQAELARRVRRSQAYIAMLEAGRIQRPSYESLAPIAAELGCPIERIAPRRSRTR